MCTTPEAPNEPLDAADDTASEDSTPLIAQYGDESGAPVRNEVRGEISGVVIQIAGDHHGGIRL